MAVSAAAILGGLGAALSGGTSLLGSILGWDSSQRDREDAAAARYQEWLEYTQALEEQKRSNAANEELAKSNLQQQRDIAQMNYDEQVRNNNMQYQTAQQNFRLQSEQFDYQKRLNEMQMQREDTAYQRTVEDLQKAGLSPLYATSGASSSPLSSAPAPQLDLSNVRPSQFDGNGINTAAGNYLNMRQQALALMVETMNNHMNRRQAESQFYRAQRQSARLALTQLLRDAGSDLNNAYLQNKNLELQAQKLSKQNELIDEQIAASKQQRVWMDEHGYRNENWETYVISILDKLADRGSIPDKVSSIVEHSKEKVSQASESVSNAIKTATEAITGREWTDEQITSSKIWSDCTPKQTLAIISGLTKFAVTRNPKYIDDIYDLSPYFSKVSKDRLKSMSRKEAWNLLYKEELPF